MRAGCEPVMDTSERESLLLEAFAFAPNEAAASWRRWRETVDLDTLEGHYLHLLPMLAHRLDEWLADDEARQRIQGIVRRAWTRNQLALRGLASAVEALREAGVERIVVAGSAAWALVAARQKSIRPVESLELLTCRDDAALAVNTFERQGWQLLPGFPRPEGAVLDHREGVWLANQRHERLKLGWRLLPCPPELARSREKPSGVLPVEVHGVALHVPLAEEMLLQALCGYRESNQVDWRWDALLLVAAHPPDWARLEELVADEATARERLAELDQRWQAAVPEHVLKPRQNWFRRRLNKVWRDYHWHAWQAGTEVSWAGFAAYCPRRWWRVLVRSRA